MAVGRIYPVISSGAGKTWEALCALPHTGFYRFMRRISLILLAARVTLVIAMLCLIILDAVISRVNAQSPTGSASATGPSADTQKSIYMFGIKCYVANAASASDPRFNGDGSHGANFKAMGEKSYGVIWKFGPMIGKSDALIREDIDSYQNILSATFVRDDAFFQRVRSECSQIGLM